jgi:hypothetical protein
MDYIRSRIIKKHTIDILNELVSIRWFNYYSA